MNPSSTGQASRRIGFALLVGLLLQVCTGCKPAPFPAQFEDGSRTSSADTEFPEVYDSQQLDEPRQTARDTAAGVDVPDGFQVEVYASEPDLRQPIAMAMDARGRLWVAENYTYAERSVGFDENLRDRIVILEDEDGDGRSDRRTVFWDEARFLTSVEIGFGGVWVLCAPQLLFIPDTDGDDVPDGPPIVMLEGWDTRSVRHNIVNGLRWGPDGWLYGRHGIMGTSYVGVPGSPDSERTALNCAIWRFHPHTHDFQVVARGTTNSWGMDWNEHGELFFINTVIGHLWHVVPGAHYERMYGEPLRPHLYELMPQVADHVHWDTRESWNDVGDGISDGTDQAGGGHAHSGMLIYQGENWPASYRGDVLTLNLHGRRMNRDVLRREGTGYTASHAPDLFHVADTWFRGIELIEGPGGEVYVADWSDIGECHENDGVHRNSGRIFMVRHGGHANARLPDVSMLTDTRLIDLLVQGNIWYRRQARLELDRRAHSGEWNDEHRAAVREELTGRAADQNDAIPLLWCLWGLRAVGGDAPHVLEPYLQHPNAHVRTWAARLYLDRLAQESPSRAVEAMVRLASASESSGLVLLHLAGALALVPPELRWQPASVLAAHEELADDPNFARLLWYQIEPAVSADPARAVQWLSDCRLPLLGRFVARRIAESSDRDPAAWKGLVESMALAAADGSAMGAEAVRPLLAGVAEGLAGRRSATPPDAWAALVAGIEQGTDAPLRQQVRELAVVFGDGRAMESLRSLASDDETPLAIRKDAIRSLVAARDADVIPLLQEWIKDRDLAVDALQGLAAFEHPETASLIVQHYDEMYTHGRREAVSTLSSRPSYARRLLDAIESGAIDRRDVPAFQVRQMRSFGDPAIVERLQQIWPDLRTTSAEARQKIEEYRRFLTSERLATADLANGSRLFERSCASCHKLFGQGGDIGPELTGAQRDNLTYLLENIVAPSLTLAENYRMSVVALWDGRVLNGVVRDTGGATVAIQTPNELLVLPREDIDTIQESELSMMPERQLDELEPRQVVDLIGFLMSPTPVTRSVQDE